MWIFIILHCLICLIVYVCMLIGLLKSSRMIMVFVILIPVFGLACLCILEWESRGDLENKKEVGIEKLKINDEIHKSILMEEDTARDVLIPLQEALLLNDATVRRELMMDILYEDPGQFVDSLKEARMNDDTEVVHYATTAMVEVQKEFDLRLQKTEKAYRDSPEDENILNEYIGLLEEYMASGLLEGNMLNEQRRRYNELIDRKIAVHKADEEENIANYLKKIENLLYLPINGEVAETIEYVINKWPSSEKGYLLKMKYYVAIRDRKGIDNTLQQIIDRKVYLSPAGREVMDFWREDAENSYNGKSVGMERKEA